MKIMKATRNGRGVVLAALSSVLMSLSLQAFAEPSPEALKQRSGLGADGSKKGVLVLGYNCNELNWKETVWGRPPDRPGRLVRAAAEIMENGPAVAVISGGQKCPDGRGESEWMRSLLFENVRELAKFEIYPVLGKFEPEEIESRLRDVLTLEEKALNTAENISNTCGLFRGAGVSQVTLVTSPDHISRALRDALAIWGRDCKELPSRLYAAPSVTLYSARTPADAGIAKVENVVIAEPPAMKKLDLGRILRLLDDAQAVAEINRVLDERAPKPPR